MKLTHIYLFQSCGEELTRSEHAQRKLSKEKDAVREAMQGECERLREEIGRLKAEIDRLKGEVKRWKVFFIPVWA